MKTSLERKAKLGEVKRFESFNLKGGCGKVIVYTDNIPQKVYAKETGHIIMSEKSFIGKHQHLYDSETWTILKGIVQINGIIYQEGDHHTCHQGNEHYCINCADGESIIEFVKMT